MSRALGLVALVGFAVGAPRAAHAQPAPPPAPMASPPPLAPAPAPKRWLAHLTMHHGLGFLTDTIDDQGSNGVGATFGFQGGIQYRLTPTLSIGAGVDLGYGIHGSDEAAGAKAHYFNWLPTAVGRFELGRFAVASWAGVHMGSRSITEPGGAFGGDREVSSTKLFGPVVGTAFVVRIQPPMKQPLTIELGPFAQLELFSADGGTVRGVVLGLCTQVAYQAPPVAGDSF